MQIDMHDVEIFSIEISEDKSSASIRFSSLAGDKTIKLIGLVALRIEDFTMQNIVERTLSFSKGDYDDNSTNYWLNWATSLSDAHSWLSHEIKEKWKDQLKTKVLDMWVFIPSTGAQIAAVCTELTVSER